MKLTLTNQGTEDAVITNDFIIKYDTLIGIALNNPEEIVIPDGVQVIGSSVFKGIISVKKIVLPDSVRIIEDHAFSSCGSLEDINLPDELKQIGDYAFENCFKLKNIDIPSSVETIKKGAFYGSGIKEIAIPKSVKKLSERMFENCYHLSEVIIEGENVAIPPFFCSNCSRLETFDFSNVKYIGKNAFENCTDLTIRDLPESIKFIGSEAFYGNQATRELIINNIEAMENSVFADSDILSIVINVSKSADHSVHIPNGIFSGCCYLSSMRFTGSVSRLVSIGTDAFNNSRIQKVYLPDSINLISDNAFKNCRNLKTIHLPKNLKHIGDSAFYNCVKLQSADIPNGVDHIGTDCFRNCSSLVSVKYPNAMSVIPKAAFLGCSELQHFTAKHIEKVGLSAFEECKKLNDFDFSKVTGLGYLSFRDTGLKELCLPKDFMITSDYPATGAFMNTPLETADLSACESLDKISNMMFDGCSKLTDVKLSSSIAVFDDMCFYGSAIKEIAFAEKNVYIGKSAFQYCHFDKVTFKDSVEYVTIQGNSFNINDIEELIIPENLYKKTKYIWE